MDTEIFATMNNITKIFPGVIANNDIDLTIKKGEVLSLLGENGAGKTTLMKILYGMHQADEGEISIKGKKVNISSPQKAMELGIGMIHQHFTLVPVHSVAENILLTLDEPYNLKSIARKITEIGEKYELEVDPYAIIREMPVGHQQRVEIIKAIMGDTELLIMDEPTAVLTPQETEKLFKFVREYRSEGNSVIFITHKLNEVMEISDRVAVLRDGEKVGDLNISEATERKLTKMMVGREFDLKVAEASDSTGKEVLEVNNISVKSNKGNRIINQLSLKIKAGEIYGLAGVSGNGQIELAEAIIGLRNVDKGEIFLENKDITNEEVIDSIKNGIGYIPADRQKEGLVLDMTVEENIILKSLHDSNIVNKGWLIKNKISDIAENKIKAYSIKTSSKDATVRSLSGGNQQKVVISRELSIGSKLLIATQPTRGLDLGAANYVRESLINERDEGKAILLISNELSEILELSDRIGVIYEGEILAEFNKEEADVDQIGLLMTGIRGDQVG